MSRGKAGALFLRHTQHKIRAPHLPPLSALKRLLCQDVEGQLVWLAVEVFVQGVFEESVVGGRDQK